MTNSIRRKSHVMKKINLNISWSYFEKLTHILSSLFMTPILFNLLGGENYAIIGLYILLQNFVIRLDFGIFGTFSREISINRSNNSYIEQLTTQFEYIYFIIFVVIFSFFYLVNGQFFFDWSDKSNLNIHEFQNSLKIIGIIISLSFCSLLYQSGLRGFEQHFIIELIKIIFHISKFIGGAIFLYFVSNNIRNFLFYILIITLIEVIFFICFFYFFSKQNFFSKIRKINTNILKKITPFSISLAYNSIISIIIVEVFQIIVSRSLTPIEFSYFTLMIIISRVVLETSFPIRQIIRTKLIYLYSEKKINEFRKILFDYSNYTAFITFSISIVIYTHKDLVIYAWLKDKEAMKWISDIIFFFLIGNAFRSISFYSHIVCDVMGKWRLINIIQSLVSIFGLALIFYLLDKYGVLGAGLFWLMINLVLFILLPMIIFIKFVPNFFIKWISSIFLIVITIIINCFLLNTYLPFFSLGNSIIVIFEAIIRGVLIMASSFPILIIIKKLYKI